MKLNSPYSHHDVQRKRIQGQDTRRPFFLLTLHKTSSKKGPLNNQIWSHTIVETRDRINV
jgi:hypothetical protein